MTAFDPASCPPSYETSEDGDHIRASWPALVTYTRSQQNPESGVFSEFSPLPGGLFLAGVGHIGDPSLRTRFREEVLAYALAGSNPSESLWTVLDTKHSLDNDSSACYVRFDPVDATLRIEGYGSEISTIRLVSTAEALIPAGFETQSLRVGLLTLYPGEALVLIAHPNASPDQVSAAIREVLRREWVNLRDMEDVSGLWLALDATLGPTACLLFHHLPSRVGADEHHGSRRFEPCTPGRATTPAELEILD
jgi:hypothetical protein